MIDFSNAKSIHLLGRALDIAAQRHQLLSQNLANVNTPEYKRIDLDINQVISVSGKSDELEMARTHSRHFGNTESLAVPPVIISETGTAQRFDGNNIDVEHEMTQIMKNSLYFQAVSQKLQGKFETLKKVINGS